MCGLSNTQTNVFPRRRRINPRLAPGVFLFPAAAAVLLVVLAGCENRVEPKASVTQFHLGTACTVTLYDRAKPTVLDEVFDRVKTIEQYMSFQRAESEVTAINDAAGERPVRVSSETFYVIEEAIRFSGITGGAFDITVGPLVEVWGIGTEQASVPGEEKIEELLPLVDYTELTLNEEEQTVFLEKRGMKIDLGGIAKGYAADEAVTVLIDRGITRGIIDFGGNIFALGSKTEETSWRIGVQHPRGKRGSSLGILEIGQQAVVSSGDYERFLIEAGVRYHHILDTTTGYPVRNSLISVTVVAGDSLTADAFSTAVFSMGLKQGLAFLDSRPGVEGILVTEDNEVHITEGLGEVFTLTDAEFSLVPR